MPYTLLSQAVLLLLIFIVGCSTHPQSLPVIATLVPADEMPSFTDDLGLAGLSVAVQRQLAVLRVEADRQGLQIGEERYHTKQLLESLERFNRLLAEANACLKTGEVPARCNDALGKQIRDQFLVYRVGSSLLTGYYTPTIEVSTKRSEKYRYPIYRTPATESERGLSREAIDFEHKLAGKGYEIYYAADRYDLYVLHIEGGAKVTVHHNGSSYTRYLLYDGDNGREFRHLDEYMVNKGMLRPSQRSRWAQRNYLSANPDKVRRIFSSCPGYVFFKVSDSPPIASTGATLTANRSLASDPAYYPVKGAIAYVVAPIPEPPAHGTPPESNPKGMKYRTMGRFFIDQDIGHFITGPARADLFFGEGPYAEFLANNFMTRGPIYLLLSK